MFMLGEHVTYNTQYIKNERLWLQVIQHQGFCKFKYWNYSVRSVEKAYHTSDFSFASYYLETNSDRRTDDAHFYSPLRPSVGGQQNEQLPFTPKHWTQKRQQHRVLENHVLAWDRHKNVAALNHFMGSQPSPFNKCWLNGLLMNITNQWKQVAFDRGVNYRKIIM